MKRSRPPRARLLRTIISAFSVAAVTLVAHAAAPTRPNVLFIAVDDLNDWIGPLRGHPQVKTPHLDRLASRGITFTNAHCAAPLCNPSRAAVFSGHQPFQTGILANDEKAIRTARPDAVLLPQHFQQAGYRTYGTGKLLHQKGPGLCETEFYPEQRWSPFTPEAVNYTAAELPSKASADPQHHTVLKGRPVVLPLNRMPSDRAAASPGGESFGKSSEILMGFPFELGRADARAIAGRSCWIPGWRRRGGDLHLNGKSFAARRHDLQRERATYSRSAMHAVRPLQ